MARAKGHCFICNAEVAGAAATRHVAKCAGPGDARLVTMTARRGGPWWLCLSVAPNASLRDLDRLLRDTWLECCGHLSGFNIGGVRFTSASDLDGRSMAAKVGTVLAAGDKFTHEYDFGSTTELAGTVAAHGVAPGPKGVRVLAQNDEVQWPCLTCGKVASALCSCCGAMVCTACEVPCNCLGKHHDDLSRVVNSPRMGVCGF